MYSQIKDKLSKLKFWKAIIALLFILIIWQCYNNNTQAHAGTIEQIAGIATITNETQTPASVQQQSYTKQWDNAKFLSVVDTSERVRYTNTDLFCLAKNVYHEAGNQSHLGKLAVAQVTINRMKHPKFNKTVCGVVFEPYQFSWANNRKMRWFTPKESKMWEDSKEVAREALIGGARIKGMEDAIFYHATYVKPGWRHVVRLTQIGAHVFYTQA